LSRSTVFAFVLPQFGYCLFALHKDNGGFAYCDELGPMSVVPIPIASSTSSSASWLVLKFGGTSVSTRARWDKIAAIAKAWREQGKHVLIVVSAL